MNILITGILLSGTYALVALGLTLQYGVSRIMNLGNGETLVAACFVAFWLFTAFAINPLVGLLLIGSVTGAQMGTQVASKVKPEILRLILASIVLAIALRMFFGLFVQPDEIYTVAPL